MKLGKFVLIQRGSRGTGALVHLGLLELRLG